MKYKVKAYHLRALLFWATVGVRSSKGGSYCDIPEIVEGLAKAIGYKLEDKPCFKTAKGE